MVTAPIRGAGMRAKPSSAGGADRLAPQAFYNAAFKILGESGHETLTVDLLCARLEVTKGSFYHHFANTTEFVAGLLQCWESTFEQYFHLAESLDPASGIEASWPVTVNPPYEAEAALRSWAASNPMVASTVRRVDRKTEEVIGAALAPIVNDPERFRLLAFMSMALISGMQQRPRPLDRELMAAVTLEFLRTNLGVEVEVDGDRLRVVKLPDAAAG
jgi:AcrR family transcriptional regulator